ncbi:hypothetical protein QU487_14925 [Crenobacter sp. SG2305]|uniref:hypothetical protein n=1 Tax=Crenobacter oryzisoli TaxID=3056844 RepID=UPI0025AA540F|nr:hypothetical protein [Crenobacter sp. SG2305]MDN0084030.1 hypothetical protein [Crenobacter sp. SG2305]
MTAIHLPHPVLSVRAGPGALATLRRDGLSPAMVSTLPGSAGGPKAIGLTGLDQAVFGWLAGALRERELVGASIGAWRFACALQADPAAALARLAERYTVETYPPGSTVQSITRQTETMLMDILGDDGFARLLDHPHYRLTLLLVRARGLLASEGRLPQLGGLVLAASLNAASRRLIRFAFSRVLCHHPASMLTFAPDDGLPTERVLLDSGNLRAALMGTVAIPLALAGVTLPGAAEGRFRDGGLADYHIDYPFARRDGITLYPHFTDRIVPGWFDKFLPWRSHDTDNQCNTVLVSPSREYLAKLPLGRLPDRGDFKRFAGRDAERIKAWRQSTAESQRLGDAFLELVEKQRLGEVATLL